MKEENPALIAAKSLAKQVGVNVDSCGSDIQCIYNKIKQKVELYNQANLLNKDIDKMTTIEIDTIINNFNKEIELNEAVEDLRNLIKKEKSLVQRSQTLR